MPLGHYYRCGHRDNCLLRQCAHSNDTIQLHTGCGVHIPYSTVPLPIGVYRASRQSASYFHGMQCSEYNRAIMIRNLAKQTLLEFT